MSALREFRIYNLKFTIKLLFLLLILYIVHFTFFITPASAQESTNSAIPYTLTPIPSQVSPASPVYTDLLVHNMFHTFSCLAVGQSVIGQPCLTYQVQKNAQGAIQSVPVLSQTDLSGGALGATTSLIGALYANPPVRTVDYLASVGEGLGIAKKAHAQVVGSGANVLSPILKLWQVSRNIAYVIMIIIFVIIGLMVMFRQRINPQTVITAQAALPGLVIGLVLITFSYFLAGLISDMAFVGTNIVGAYFSAASAEGGGNNTQNLVDSISRQSILELFTPFTRAFSRGDISNAINSIWDDLAAPNTTPNPLDLDPQKTLTYLAMLIVAQLVLPFAGLLGPVGQLLFGGIAVTATGLQPVAIVSFLIGFIVMIILIYSMLKLLLRLISNYISIIFLTIIAPFQLLFSALPGRQGMATNWIRNMLANVLAFPAVLAVLYFVAFLLGPNLINQNCASPCPFKVAPTEITGTANFPLFGGLDVNFIKLLLAFGALVALPKIPDIVARAVGGVSEAGQIIGQEIGAGVNAGRGYAGQFQQGISGFAGQVGPITPQPVYTYNPATGRYEFSPMQSRPGVTGTIGGFIARPGPWYKKVFGVNIPEPDKPKDEQEFREP